MNPRERLTAALTLPNFDGRAAQDTMNMSIRKGGRRFRPKDKPGLARIAAVMMLLYPHQDDICLLYTKRPSSLRDHSGQISFPGGRVEAGEGLAAAALRECGEEVGVAAEEIDVVGQLTTLYIPPSDFYVHPFVGWCAVRPTFRPSHDEVAAIIEAPLALLLDPATIKCETWIYDKQQNLTMDVPFYNVFGHKVWGATAIMTAELLARWQTVT